MTKGQHVIRTEMSKTAFLLARECALGLSKVRVVSWCQHLRPRKARKREVHESVKCKDTSEASRISSPAK